MWKRKKKNRKKPYILCKINQISKQISFPRIQAITKFTKNLFIQFIKKYSLHNVKNVYI